MEGINAKFCRKTYTWKCSCFDKTLHPVVGKGYEELGPEHKGSRDKLPLESQVSCCP